MWGVPGRGVKDRGGAFRSETQNKDQEIVLGTV